MPDYNIRSTNGFDVQSATEVAKVMRGIARRAETFGHDRERVLEEIIYYAENMEKLAQRIEDAIFDEIYTSMSITG